MPLREEFTIYIEKQIENLSVEFDQAFDEFCHKLANGRSDRKLRAETKEYQRLHRTLTEKRDRYTQMLAKLRSLEEQPKRLSFRQEFALHLEKEVETRWLEVEQARFDFAALGSKKSICAECADRRSEKLVAAMDQLNLTKKKLAHVRGEV